MVNWLFLVCTRETNNNIKKISKIVMEKRAARREKKRAQQKPTQQSLVFQRIYLDFRLFISPSEPSVDLTADVDYIHLVPSVLPLLANLKVCG